MNDPFWKKVKLVSQKRYKTKLQLSPLVQQQLQVSSTSFPRKTEKKFTERAKDYSSGFSLYKLLYAKIQ